MPQLQFQEPFTGYQGVKREAKRVGYDTYKSVGPVAFYNESMFREMMEDLKTIGSFVLRATQILERQWFVNERPYYRIFPDYVPIFSSTSLDVPSKYALLPFDSFAINFARGYEPLIADIPVVSVLVGSFDSNVIEDVFIGGIKRHHPDDFVRWKILFDEKKSALKAERDLTMIWYLDLSRTSLADPNYEGRDYFRMSQRLDIELDPNMSLNELLICARERRIEQEEVMKTLENSKPGGPDDKEWSMAREVANNSDPLWKIALSVAFLAVGGDRLIEPDVLNKDFRVYLDAVNKKNENSVTQLHDKATKKRNCQGWTVGRADALLGKRPFYNVDSESDNDYNRRLNYQHQRKGHMHLYRTGAGRDKPVLKFVSQTTVRADLPLDPKKRGHRTLKQAHHD